MVLFQRQEFLIKNRKRIVETMKFNMNRMVCIALMKKILYFHVITA